MTGLRFTGRVVSVFLIVFHILVIARLMSAAIRAGWPGFWGRLRGCLYYDSEPSHGQLVAALLFWLSVTVVVSIFAWKKPVERGGSKPC